MNNSHSHNQLLNARHPQTNVIRLRSTRQELNVKRQSSWSIASVHGYFKNKKITQVRIHSQLH